MDTAKAPTATIPDAAIEAAAEVLGRLVGTVGAAHSETFQRDARAVLAAALPHLADELNVDLDLRDVQDKAYQAGVDDTIRVLRGLGPMPRADGGARLL